MSLYMKVEKRLGDFVLDLEFSSEKGVSGLLGASGCGKTLTLRCIAGIVTPDEGKIILNGTTLYDSERGINLPPQARRVGYLFQNYALFPNMTVEQNIACGLHHEKNKSLRKKAVADMISRMHLVGLEKHRPHQLSGGQQQRTALARILVGQPEILLLDEPFSALDSHLKDQLLAELRDTLKTFDKDTLIVTHNRDEAYKLCNTMAVMDKGRILSTGNTKEMFADPGTRIGATITGCKNIIEAKKASDTSVEVPAWGVTFNVGRQVRDDLCAIGIRAHSFYAEYKPIPRSPGFQSGVSRNTASTGYSQDGAGTASALIAESSGGSGADTASLQTAETAANVFPIRIIEEIEEPFEWTVKFMFLDQSQDSEVLWWRISKDRRKAVDMPERLAVAPKDILLLYA
jgi:molybdate transport system ATP-binding protein